MITITIAEAKSLFWNTFVLTLALKILLAAGIPFTADEAFFDQWGLHPDWGFYDHPPMVGWLLALLHQFGDGPLVLRSVTLLISSVVGLGMVQFLRRLLPDSREASAWLAGAVYLVMPWSWLFVLVTTDTLLVLFMAMSAYAYLRADTARNGAWIYAAAGLFLGLAFLSKYFAALLGFAYAAHILFLRRERWWALLLVFLFALPSIGLNLAYNATHGWPNVMFNVFNRNEGTHWQLGTPLLYAAMILYLLTPWLVWQAARSRGLPGFESSSRTRRAAAVLWLFPIALFAVISLRKTIGLHWVVGFIPIFVVWAALRLEPMQLRRSFRWTLWLSAPHLLLIGAIAWGPLSLWQSFKIYDRAVFLRETSAIVDALRETLPADATLMARGYAPAAMLAYRYGRYVPVFGPGRFHARQDDLLVDFRNFDGRAIRVFDYSRPDPADFEPYFESVSVGSIEVAGARFYYVDGQGFRFASYREKVLAQIAHDYHNIPKWLPFYGNPFCERYEFPQCSPGRDRVAAS